MDNYIYWRRTLLKVFLSWSGDVSKRAATIFREWISSVIQVVEPYMSQEDISKGARWGIDISRELETSSFGIIFITPENVAAPWLHFEAGALSKSIEDSFVSPFLLGVKNSDLVGPVSLFQSTIPTKEDVKRLIISINEASQTSKLSDIRLNSIFDKWWPDLETRLAELVSEIEGRTTMLSPAEDRINLPQDNKILSMVEELLELSRRQQRELFSKDYFDMIVRASNTRNHVSREAYRDLLIQFDNLKNILFKYKDYEAIPSQDINEIITLMEKPLNHIERRTFGYSSVGNKKYKREIDYFELDHNDSKIKDEGII